MPRVPRRSLPVALALALALAAPAAAVPPPLGGLTPFPGGSACFNSTGTNDCTAYAPQADGRDLVVAGDVVYAASTGAVMAYRRAASGALAAFDCVASVGPTPCPSVDPDLGGAARIVVAGSSKTLYVTVGTTTATSRVLAFRLAADGGIGPRVSCISEQPAAGCANVQGLDAPRDLDLAPDGGTLYTASDGAGGGLAAFALAADGRFTATPQRSCVGPSGCVADALSDAADVEVRGTNLYAAWHGSGQTTAGVEVYPLTPAGGIGAPTGCVVLQVPGGPVCTTAWDSLDFPSALVVAPDGRSLAVGSSGGTITTLALGPAGAIGSRLSCEAASPILGCTTDAGLGLIADLAVSPDGLDLYAGAHNGIWGFARDPVTGSTAGTSTCISAPPLTCPGVGSVTAVSGVAVTPDGARLYASSAAPGGLTLFQREVGPSCLPTSVTVVPPAGPAVANEPFSSATVTASCTDANGDPITYELVDRPRVGVAAVSATGSMTYTVAVGFSGTDSFTFRATDGSVASAPAHVAVSVIAPPATDPVRTPPTVIAPLRSTVDRVRSPIGARALIRFSGRATGDGLERVEIAIVRLDHGARAAARRPRAACRRLQSSGRLSRAVRARAPCPAGGFLTASGTARWTFNLLRPLPAGRYVIVSRARGRAAIESGSGASAGNRRAFTVR